MGPKDAKPADSQTADPRPLLILDLDETLISSRLASLDRPADFTVDRYFVYRRPYLTQFLIACSAVYELAVWSSASEDYVREILERITPEGVSFAFVWTRERCTRRFDRFTDDQSWLKDLKKVKRRGYSLSRVIIVEDIPTNVARHYGNCISVRPYSGEADDDELERLAGYLIRLAGEPDFRSIDKRRWRDG